MRDCLWNGLTFEACYNKRQLYKWKDGWFNTRCDLMAWVGENSKERLWGTKQGWRVSDGLAIEEPSYGEEESTCI